MFSPSCTLSQSPPSIHAGIFRPFRISAVCASPEINIPTAARQCSSSLYDVLGVQVGASCREIKTAYRRLAREVHPDVVSRGASSDEFIKIRGAYSILSDPHQRAGYDRLISRHRFSSPLTVATDGYGHRQRSWETDQCW